MGFRIFSSQPSPIAIDFGSTSVKLLQVDGKDKPAILAAAELPVPEAVRQDPIQRIAYLEQHLPGVLKSSHFKGRRATFVLPTAQTIIQHMQLTLPDGVKQEEAVKTQLQISMSIAPESVVVRSHKVAETVREGQSRTEVICFAIPRDLIMQHVELLEKLRLQVSGVQAQPIAVVRAFDHIYRREGDANLTTMYIDLGYASTCVAIAHGSDIIFARAIQVGGLHFDQLIAKALRCDLAGARAHRLSLADVPESSSAPEIPVPPAGRAAPAVPAAASPKPSASAPADDEDSGGMARLTAAMAREEAAAAAEQTEESATLTADDRRVGKPPPVIARDVAPGDGHKSAANVDFSELLETITDELSMCLRYHRGVFPNRAIDRVILLGGEARQNWMCRHVAKALRLPARLGDPLARFAQSARGPECFDRSQPQPGWSAVCGLCAGPTGA